MIVNDPNIAIWANQRYKQVQRVGQTARANRTNPDERREQEQSRPKRRRPEPDDGHAGVNLDVVA